MDGCALTAPLPFIFNCSGWRWRRCRRAWAAQHRPPSLSRCAVSSDAHYAWGLWSDSSQSIDTTCISPFLHLAGGVARSPEQRGYAHSPGRGTIYNKKIMMMTCIQPAELLIASPTLPLRPSPLPFFAVPPHPERPRGSASGSRRVAIASCEAARGRGVPPHRRRERVGTLCAR